MPVIQTERKRLSQFLKQTGNMETEGAGNFYYARVTVKAGSDTPIDGIGVPILWNEADSAFNILAAPADWVALTAYVVGDIVKPATRDGNEYVCTVAGTSDAAEPTFNQIPNGSTVDATVTWETRAAYTSTNESSLPNAGQIAYIVGPESGKGLNEADIVVTAAGVSVTALFRGDAFIVNAGIEWGSVAVADQAEFITATEKLDIAVMEAADVVDPFFVS